MLAKSKLNSAETLISQTSIHLEISYEEFITIVKEKEKYDKMKENLRNKWESRRKTEKMRINRVNSRT